MDFLVADLTRETGREQEFSVIETRGGEGREAIRPSDGILRISRFPGASHETNRTLNKIGKSK